jgi:hypothetical protein
MNAFQEARQMRLRLMNINYLHARMIAKSLD